MTKKVIINGLKLPGLFERNGTFVFRKAIPECHRPIVGRREFVLSLKTRDPNEAVARYGSALAAFNLLLDDARKGVAPHTQPVSSDTSAFDKYLSSIDLPYRHFDSLIQGFDLSEANFGLSTFLERAALWDTQGKPDDRRFDALFGSIKPTATLTALLDHYIQHTRLERVGLNDREIGKKLNPKRLVIRNLQDFLGTDDTAAVTREVVRSFREHFVQRISAGELKGDTANKQLGHLRTIFDAAIESGLFQAQNPFVGVRLPEKGARRNSFSLPFVRNVLLPAIDTLDPVCRALLWVTIDTGAHFSELCGLHPDRDIRLGSGPVNLH